MFGKSRSGAFRRRRRYGRSYVRSNYGSYHKTKAWSADTKIQLPNSGNSSIILNGGGSVVPANKKGAYETLYREFIERYAAVDVWLAEDQVTGNAVDGAGALTSGHEYPRMRVGVVPDGGRTHWSYADMSDLPGVRDVTMRPGRKYSYFFKPKWWTRRYGIDNGGVKTFFDKAHGSSHYTPMSDLNSEAYSANGIKIGLSGTAGTVIYFRTRVGVTFRQHNFA